MFRLNKKGNVEYYTIDSFEKTGLVKHCFTTRRGGVSSPPYDSMNLRMNTDDSYENIKRNFEIICDTIDIDYRKLVFSTQVHDDKIYTASERDMGKGLMRKSDIESADGLICDKSGVPIITFYADCVPLYFLDRRNGVIALSHSGWKGTVKRIGQKTVSKMMQEYASRTEDILCAVGPSIGVCHFEVGDDIADVFRDEFGADVLEKHEKYHVNLQKAICKQLDEAGIPRENITVADICTYCHGDLLFSHRKTNGVRGNLAAIMELI